MGHVGKSPLGDTGSLPPATAPTPQQLFCPFLPCTLGLQVKLSEALQVLKVSAAAGRWRDCKCAPCRDAQNHCASSRRI